MVEHHRHKWVEDYLPDRWDSKMADLDVNDPLGFTDKRRGRGVTGATQVVEVANMSSISALKTRLTALKPSSYTAARMNSMTENDLLYALRLESADAAGI